MCHIINILKQLLNKTTANVGLSTQELVICRAAVHGTGGPEL